MLSPITYSIYFRFWFSMTQPNGLQTLVVGTFGKYFSLRSQLVNCACNFVINVRLIYNKPSRNIAH